ncbi:MAG TPA: 50S ribosomal protein L24 [Patescibacteria group bacterium]|nr:50S ribosomal protein L24 [Patescibacteria group bacterium]
MRLKKGDNILVISGKSRGKRGVVEKVIPPKEMVIVAGVNLAKHHLKPSRKNPHGGIMDILAPIRASNVILICPRCAKPTRIGTKMVSVAGQTKASKKMRVCKKCRESVD